MPTALVPLRQVTRWHRPLMLLVASMLLLAVTATAGLLLDDRVLLGAPVWLKPLKFALSFVIYGTTLAWMLSLPHRGRRWTSLTATVLAVTAFLDVGIVAVQAARGTLSHFNDSTAPVEELIGEVFGWGVMALIVANLVLAVLLVFQHVGDRATSRAIHAGVALAVIGMMLGFLMGSHSELARNPQVIRDAGGQEVRMGGGHSVGVPDGGPGMPLTGWSTTGGDLRIPHFVGLHGLQAMLLLVPALEMLASRIPQLRDGQTRVALVSVAAAGYAGLVALVTWQALRGQPLVHPDGLTMTAFGALTAAVAAATWAVLAAGRRRSVPTGSGGGRPPARI